MPFSDRIANNILEFDWPNPNTQTQQDRIGNDLINV